MPVTMTQARDAKAKALAMARARGWPTMGIGLGQTQGRLAIKVNLSRAADGPLPTTIGGVKVIYEVVGALTKR